MTFSVQDLYFGAFAGSIPTISMMLTSIFTVKADLSATFQASAQNLCAGLILGAVAKELFPQLNSESQLDKLVGISVGFFAGLFFVNFLDYVVEWFENKCNESVTSEIDPEKMHIELTSSSSYQSLNNFEDDIVDVENGGSKKGSSPTGSFKGSPKGKGSPTNSQRKHSMDDPTDTDAPVLQLASQAIASPTHRDKIRKKVSELVKSIDNIEEKSNFLLISGRSGSQGQSLSDLNEETYADQIDEEIHKLQYNLDHCRRLIQGSESNIVGVVPRLWITESGKLSLRDGIVDLKQGAASLVRFLHQDKHDTESLVEIHRNMAEMDNQITHLHETVEEYSFKWGRRGHKRALIIIPQTGSHIPLGLIIPVTVDCIVDGFLVGTTCSISHQAGLILALANCIEMGFLGLAVSMRIRNCTASSVYARYAALILPPFVMFLSSVLGAFIGAAARAQPMVYIGFISFGVVALLYLVVNELLVEARESLAGIEQWWTGMVIFIGIYMVLILDMFLG